MTAATPQTCAHMTDHAGCVWHTRTWSEAPDHVPARCAGCPDAAAAPPRQDSEPDGVNWQPDHTKRFFRPD